MVANTFDVTKEIPNTTPQQVNEDYSATNGQTIVYSNYTMSVSREGTSNNYYPRYTFTSSGAGTTVIFESLLSSASYQVRYSTNGGTSWTIPTNQVVTTPSNNRRLISFDPVTIYTESGGITIKVSQLFRDSRNDRSLSDIQSRSYANGNVSGTAIPPTIIISKTSDKSVVQLRHASAPGYTPVNASDINFTKNIFTLQTQMDQCIRLMLK
ncbi:MAG: hypothetical protein IPF54_18885 [Draconibacterium sp.]|nr:hypothetical protein [Draconibacterium sp.]